MERLNSLFRGPADQAWRFFDTITQIPRPSGHEEQIRNWILSVGCKYGWESHVDTAGNVLLRVPGRGRMVDQPPLILQGHLDMVCEKHEETKHDFLRDPIPIRIEGDWICTEGTTLGADNGVAPALALGIAVHQTPTDRVPLELLFTVDEETGLTGAMNLDPSPLHGRRLLNLDSGRDTELVIGCAGGIDLRMEIPLSTGNSEVCGTSFHLTGLMGGHSGTNIHENRGNAIVLCAEILEKLHERIPGIELCLFRGGNKKNAIPRDAHFMITGNVQPELEKIASAVLDTVRDREPGIRFEADSVVCPETRIGWNAIEFITRFPNGVLAMEPDFPGLVRTSCSLGVATMSENKLTLTAHGRSALTEERKRLQSKIQGLAESIGITFEPFGDYPGWSPVKNSKMLKHVKEVYRKVYGYEPDVNAIHAGLEAGIIGDKLGTGELIAFGPTMEGYHSPRERLSIKSFEQVFQFLLEFVSS